MGKKHQQPLPIDIFNAPSPGTLLYGASSKSSSVGGRTKPQSKLLGVPTPGSVMAASPVSRDGSAFPDSPVPPSSERIEDYGDGVVQSDHSSCASEVFSSDADDGHANELASDDSSDDSNFNDDSSGDDAEDDDVDNNDNLAQPKPPARKRARDEAVASDDDSDEGGSESAPENITVEFDAVEMEADDVDNVMHLMDQILPDHRVEIDRDEFGALLHASPFTTLVKIADDDDDATDGDSSLPSKKEVYGMVSLINVAASIETHKASLGNLEKLLKDSIWQVLSPGIGPHELLTSLNDKNKAKALWFISEHIRTVPPELVSRLLDFLSTQFDDAYKPASATAAKKSASKESDVAYPCMFMILAKVQRDATSAAAEKAKLKKSSKGPRGDAGAVIDLAKDFIFWREEDEILFRLRDTRVAVHAYRCRPQYDEQPEPERPVTIAFALSSNDFIRGLGEIKKSLSA